MVGIPLLAETLAETHRAKIAATMMTGGAVGTFIGAWAYGLVGPYGWRYVFFVGVVPAIILAIMRGRMLDPERFADVRERRRAVAAGLTQRSRRPRVHALCAVAAVLQGAPLQHDGRGIVRPRLAAGDWTTNIWLPTILSLMAQKSGAADATAAVPFVSRGIMLWSLGGICGYIAFGFICDIIGRRLTVIFYSVGTIVFGLILYLALPGL